MIEGDAILERITMELPTIGKVSIAPRRRGEDRKGERRDENPQREIQSTMDVDDEFQISTTEKKKRGREKKAKN
jgi:hypothetical protein